MELNVMEGSAKKELLRLAKRLRAKAVEFERAKDYGRAEQARVYVAYLEEIAKGFKPRNGYNVGMQKSEW
jgi:hypothetical protein